MRAWIIFAALMIATAIRPELAYPKNTGATYGIVVGLFLLGGLVMDLIEFNKKPEE